MMESLFRLTELESKIPLNLNVLIKGRIPKVVGLAECLREWLDHLRDVLVRRSNYRKAQIEHRLEVLGGYLIAYLNIDKVIKIIRTEDEPKPALMKAFKLTEVQADAILNMRLRSLRKLEEFEIRTEDKNLRGELKGIKALLGSETEQWSKVGEQVRKVRDMFGPKTPLGKRRTMFADAPEHDLAAIEEAFVEREPVHGRDLRKGLGAHAEGPCRRSLGARPSRPTTSSTTRSSPRPPRSCCCLPPTANSIRSTSQSCRAAAAMASRSACSSTWSRTPRSSRCSSTRAAANS